MDARLLASLNPNLIAKLMPYFDPLLVFIVEMVLSILLLPLMKFVMMATEFLRMDAQIANKTLDGVVQDSRLFVLRCVM